MPSRDYRLDLLSAGLVTVALFLTGSFVSFDPADPPTDHVYPVNTEINNWCGRAGAWVASEFVELLGVGAFGVVGLIVVAAIAIGLRLTVRQGLRQAAGVVLMTLAISTLLHRVSIESPFNTVAGPGGSIGAALALLADHHLSVIGSLFILIPTLLAGIVLTFGSYAFIAAAAIGRGARSGALGAKRGLSTAASKVAHALTPRKKDSVDEDEDESEEEEAEEDGEAAAELEEEEEEYEEEESDEDEDGLKIVRTGFDQAPLPAVKFAAPQKDETASVQLPTLDILEDAEPFVMDEHDLEIRERAKLLEKTFAEFAMKVKVVQIDTGPVVTQYEIELEPGLRARKVIALSDDIAIALKASSVRIVAPIPGKTPSASKSRT